MKARLRKWLKGVGIALASLLGLFVLIVIVGYVRFQLALSSFREDQVERRKVIEEAVATYWSLGDVEALTSCKYCVVTESGFRLSWCESINADSASIGAFSRGYFIERDEHHHNGGSFYDPGGGVWSKGDIFENPFSYYFKKAFDSDLDEYFNNFCLL